MLMCPLSNITYASLRCILIFSDQHVGHVRARLHLPVRDNREYSSDTSLVGRVEKVGVVTVTGYD